MTKRNLLLLLLSLFVAEPAFAQKATAPKAPQEGQPQKTQDASLDPKAKVGVGNGDGAKEVQSMLDTATCTHTGKYFYQVDPYGQLALGIRMNCKAANSGPTQQMVFWAPLCQLDANLQCDNRKSTRAIGKVAFGQNYYGLTLEGVLVNSNSNKFPWLDSAGAAQSLPLIKATAARQTAALQKILGKH